MSEQTEQILEDLKLTIKPLSDDEQRRRAVAQLNFNERKRQATIASLRVGWGAPERHLQCVPKLDNEWGQSLASVLVRLGSGFLLALVGTRGNGKTQLAVELMRAVTGKLKPAKFTTAVQFFMCIKASYGSTSEVDEREVLKQFRKPSLLVIDEVGKRGNTDWENNLLFELINQRYNDMTDTLLIDNQSKAEFEERIGPSLSSRMNETGGIKECTWESFRK